MAKILPTEHGAVDVDRVIGVGAFELEATLQIDPTFLEEPEREHDDAVTSFVIQENRPADLNIIMPWLAPLLME